MDICCISNTGHYLLTVEVISTGADDLNWVGPLPPYLRAHHFILLNPARSYITAGQLSTQRSHYHPQRMGWWWGWLLSLNKQEIRLRTWLANCPAVFLAYFSLWICYETELTNTKSRKCWIGQLISTWALSNLTLCTCFTNGEQQIPSHSNFAIVLINTKCPVIHSYSKLAQLIKETWSARPQCKWRSNEAKTGQMSVSDMLNGSTCQFICEF